ncbi:nuclear transport factor 2 family protein [Streptomyces flavofungini]|uniref:Nuclear transport factor 2 family protein n=1 Tax=Streptomyces flavofungini TaxID=68200 RepID=A0ABS0XC67_9ACTN|nr:nuclear transport factor 2 family protein [Streptomyces flavofungini]MBJ3810792.1 nuclear transport factor 2 family protein [Streptomyces flavofungini]GHC62147.1 hypothetical protein GCM10010349_32440 [Streptomyces flavofungini]
MFTESTETAETAASTTVEDATRATADAFLAATAARDSARLAELFADDVDWLLAENPACPWIRPRATGAECATQAEDLARYTVAEDARASVDTYLVTGQDAIIMGHLSGTVRATGKSFEGPFALRLTVEGGRITRHHLYENSLSVAAACTP